MIRKGVSYYRRDRFSSSGCNKDQNKHLMSTEKKRSRLNAVFRETRREAEDRLGTKLRILKGIGGFGKK